MSALLKARTKLLKSLGVETNRDLATMSEEDYAELLKEARGELIDRDEEYRQGGRKPPYSSLLCSKCGATMHLLLNGVIACPSCEGAAFSSVVETNRDLATMSEEDSSSPEHFTTSALIVYGAAKVERLIPRLPAPAADPIDFAPYFNMSHPLPAERTLRGYCLDVPMEDYKRFPGVNASLLSNRTQCEMLHYLTETDTESFTEATILGTVLHWAVLEPWKFQAKHRDDHMMICDTAGLQTKAAAAQREENPGILLVTHDIMDKAHRCIEAIQLHDEAMEILKEHKNREVSGFVFDAVNEVWRKIRFDLFSPSSNIIPDVKTTRRHPADFFKDVMEFGYDKQAAWYLDTHTLLTGEFREKFSWIVVSKQEPFMCRVFHMINRTPDDPLWEDSRLKAARERLGLGPPSARIERLPMFIAAAKETLSTREMGGQLTPQVLRRIWSGYEYESPSPEIY